MYIETSSPRKHGERANLTVAVPNMYNGEKTCLSFYYHMYGTTVQTLMVYSGRKEVFNISGNQENKWKMMQRNLYLDSSVSRKGLEYLTSPTLLQYWLMAANLHWSMCQRGHYRIRWIMNCEQLSNQCVRLYATCFSSSVFNICIILIIKKTEN